MSTTIRNSLAFITLFSIAFLGTACSGADTPEKRAGNATEPAMERGLAETPGSASSNPAGSKSTSTSEASLMAAYKEMAASQGIYVGEVPEGFPVDFLPLYPDGEIDRSAVREREFTLLQVVPADKDTVQTWYEDFYAGLGWSSTNPVTVAGRTLGGFQGKNAEVSITLIDREEGKTFVALALSIK